MTRLRRPVLANCQSDDQVGCNAAWSPLPFVRERGRVRVCSGHTGREQAPAGLEPLTFRLRFAMARQVILSPWPRGEASSSYMLKGSSISCDLVEPFILPFSCAN